MARGLLDLLLPPTAYDSREATASAGLSPDVLIRAAPTASQGGKSARGWRMNVKSAFAVTEAGRRRIRGGTSFWSTMS